MGLDWVELVVGMEETFGISIPDEAAASMRNPRQLIDYLERQVPQAAEPQACLTPKAFFRLRGAVARILGVPRESVRPSTPWAKLLPADRAARRAAWRTLQKQVVPSAFPMVYSGTAMAGLALAGLGIGLGAGFAVHGLRFAAASWGLFVGLPATIVLALLASPYRSSPPQETVGETASVLALRRAAELKGQDARWTREEIARMVHQLMEEHLNVTNVDDETAFADMGIP